MPVDHYENFPVASILLPKHLRRPIEAIYCFARGADDIADEGDVDNTTRLHGLTEYEQELDRIERGEEPLFAAFQELAQMIALYKLPIDLFRDLLDAFAQDVVKKRYADFPELLNYCRRSANPVGRLLLYLFNRTDEKSMWQSDQICSALQLINFWQDIAIDWEKERVYLPQEDLVSFAVPETQIRDQQCNEQWAALLDFQVKRTRKMMLDGAPLVHKLPGRMGWEIRLTIQGGLKILEKIEKVQGDVFRHRPVLRTLDWPGMGMRAIFM